MREIDLVRTLDGVTPQWVTTVLRADGTLPSDRSVLELDMTQVGTGQMGDSTRLVATYDGPTDAPASFVVKLAAEDPTSRATGLATRSYEVEVRFYQELADTVAMRTPRCHAAEIDPVTGEFVLLLEDLAPAKQGDQLVGCGPTEADLAVREVAKLHLGSWGDESLPNRHGWLQRRTPVEAIELADMVRSLYPGFCERYSGRIDPDVIAVGEWFLPHLESFYDAPGPKAIVHNDYRLDNLMFGSGDPAGGPAIAVVDWQTHGWGSPLADVSYFLGAGLVPHDRRLYERELVQVYVDAINAGGVELALVDAWHAYRRAAWSGFHMAVIASMIVSQTERGDEMFCVMANRHGRHVIDLDAGTALTDGW